MEQISTSSHLILVTTLTDEIERLKTKNEHFSIAVLGAKEIKEQNTLLLEENTRLKQEIESLHELDATHTNLLSAYAELQQENATLKQSLEEEKNKHSYSK